LNRWSVDSLVQYLSDNVLFSGRYPQTKYFLARYQVKGDADLLLDDIRAGVASRLTNAGEPPAKKPQNTPNTEASTDQVPDSIAALQLSPAQIEMANLRLQVAQLEENQEMMGLLGVLNLLLLLGGLGWIAWQRKGSRE
jgi:hypothetical protein